MNALANPATTGPYPVRTPVRIQLARALLSLVALSHLVVPAILVLNRSSLRDEIARKHPDFGAAAVQRALDTAVVSGVVFHLLLLALTTVLIARLPSMRTWVLRLTIASQLASILFSAISWSQSSLFHAVIPPLDILQAFIAILVVAAWRRRRLHPGPTGP